MTGRSCLRPNHLAELAEVPDEDPESGFLGALCTWLTYSRQVRRQAPSHTGCVGHLSQHF